VVLLVKIICFTNPAGKTIVTGFQGLGYVGAVSVDHLINELRAKRVGYVETTFVPPVVVVSGKGLQLPYEIYEYRDILIFRFEGLPMNRASSVVMHELVKWSKQNEIQRIIAIGGLNNSYKEGENDIVRFIANKAYEKVYGQVKPLVQEGIQIIGPLALILNYAEIYEIPALALLAYANPDRIDHRGAANALISLSKLISVDISVDKLVEKAEEIEAEEKRLISGIKREGGTRSPGMYA